MTRLPGIYDLSDDEYHGGPGISKSGLDLISRSPLSYYEQYILGNRMPPTAAMKIGTAAHKALLEPVEFYSTYLCKDYLPKDQIVPAGKIVLPGKDYTTLLRIIDSIHRHREASRIILAAGDIERAMFWNDAETGALCKIKPDKMMRQIRAIVDFKTCVNVDKFERESLLKWRYDVQAGMYLAGGNEVIADAGFDIFIFIVAEKFPPFRVIVVPAKPKHITCGEFLFRKDLATYAECLRTNEWPEFAAA